MNATTKEPGIPAQVADDETGPSPSEIARGLSEDGGPYVVATYLCWLSEDRAKAADAGVLNHCRDLGLLTRELRPTPLGRAVAEELANAD